MRERTSVPAGIESGPNVKSGPIGNRATVPNVKSGPIGSRAMVVGVGGVVEHRGLGRVGAD